jgi:glycosyltransferase involved in cell wall biosynthesis
VLSKNLVTRVTRIAPDFEVALQVHGWVGGQPRPYTLFVDQTRLMAERGWPDWLPFAGHERPRLLDLERAMYQEAFHVFTMGEPGRASLISDYDVAPGRVTVVGGGVCFRSLPVATGPARERSILFVGREFERKGGDVLLAAFRTVREQMPDAVLHIVGSSSPGRAPGVVTHGRISDRGHMARLYAGARVFCLPSHYEPFGLVLTEAMAHGVPCVGTSVQSIPEILGHGQAGLLVPPGAPEPLADALLRLLGDDALARRVGLAGRRWIEENFTWDRVAERMAPVLSSADRDLRSGP